MSEIIQINGSKVKIGTDDGKVMVVPIASISYANPKEGDEVKVYKDGDSLIVKKDKSASSINVNSEAKRSINKHVFVWVGAFLFGGFGVDRFMRGQIGAGICKLLFGWLTFGLWYFIDWIIALSKAYGSAFGDEEKISFDRSGKYMK